MGDKYEVWDMDLDSLEESPKESEKKEEPKETCPYCDWEGKSLKRHLPKCLRNPDNEPKENKLSLDDLKLKTCWEALSRVLRQLSGTRSEDWKRGALPIKNELELYLKKKNVIE